MVPSLKIFLTAVMFAPVGTAIKVLNWETTDADFSSIGIVVAGVTAPVSKPAAMVKALNADQVHTHR